MKLTTEILSKFYGEYEIKIVEQNSNFRFVEIFSDNSLQLIAFSFFPKYKNGILLSAKRAIYKGASIGETGKKYFDTSKKYLIDEGFLFVGPRLKKKLKNDDRNSLYRLFEMWAVIDKEQILFCEILEIYSKEYVNKHIRTKKGSNNKKIVHSELLTFLKKHQIVIKTD